jgi:pimeloyl-ACP methyl ester carboxylesterase
MGKPVLIDYDSRQRLEKSIADVVRYIPKAEPVTLVGHSLGGLIATLIATRNLANVQRLITVSAPLAGSRVAAYARWVTSIPCLSDIVPNSPVIREVASSRLTIPMLSIISTGGSLPGEPNDSVVAVSSQRGLRNARQLEIKANHFEIMMHEQMHDAVRRFLYEDEDEVPFC